MPKLINKTQGFTVVNGTISKDIRLGIKERGLMLTLMSLPDNWEFSVIGLTKILPDGKATIRSAVQKLEEFGYIRRVQAKDEGGKFAGYDWEIIPEPSEISPLSENRKTEDFEEEPPLSENRSTENQSTEKPSTENQTQSNNKTFNTQVSITYQSINQEDYYNNIKNADEFNGPERLIDTETLKTIKEQISYDALQKQPYNINIGFLDAAVMCIAELRVETEPQKFNKKMVSAKLIRQRSLEINESHVNYVYGCLRQERERIKNIKQYLRVSLFNAPDTIDPYYDNRVRADGVPGCN